MTEMKKIDLEQLEHVAGGQQDVVNNQHKGYEYVNCRKAPGLDSEVLIEMPNGTNVYPTGKVVVKDNIEWYEINLTGKVSGDQAAMCEYGWISGRMIGR